MADAQFEDGGDSPLYLGAEDGQDLRILSVLLQDAVFPVHQMVWHRRNRRFALLLNRFRWEDRDAAQAAGRAVERVRSLLVVDGVSAVRSRGLDRSDPSAVLSLLALQWQEGPDGTGRLELVLAGGGVIGLEVETIDVTLRDVTQPYLAPSGRIPSHET